MGGARQPGPWTLVHLQYYITSPYAPYLVPHHACRPPKETLRTHMIAFAFPYGGANSENPLRHKTPNDSMCASARINGVAWVSLVACWACWVQVLPFPQALGTADVTSCTVCASTSFAVPTPCM